MNSGNTSPKISITELEELLKEAKLSSTKISKILNLHKKRYAKYMPLAQTLVAYAPGIKK